MGCQAGNWRAFESLRILVRGLLETEELPRMCRGGGGSLCLENRSYGLVSVSHRSWSVSTPPADGSSDWEQRKP